jgi:diguanylate cyclase (GGDEF)-like protein
MRGKFAELVHRTVAAEIPLAAALTAAIFLAFGLVDGLQHPEEAEWRVGIAVAPAIVLAIAAYFTQRGQVPDGWMPALYGALAGIAMASTLGTVVLGGRAVELVYTLLIFATAGSGVMSRRIFGLLTACTALAYGAVVSRLPLTPDERWHWVMAGVVALGAAVYMLAARRRSIAALARAQQEVETQAITDPLTGRLNRHGLAVSASQLLAVARRQATPVFALFVDVDGLKSVNDSAGHEAGDRLLRAVGAEIHAAFRESDVVARWGGDEFVVIGLGNGSEPAAVEIRLVERLLANHECPHQWTPAVSAGVARLAATELGREDCLPRLVDAADGDMYRRRLTRRRGEG